MGNGNQICEQCGMTTVADSQAYLKVEDSNGTIHYVECIMCALKLLNNTKYDQLNITTYCDWYGPNSTITIIAKQHGNIVSTIPQTALDNARIVSGGSCTKNRVAYNQTAVEALIANGYSNYTTMMLRTALPSNSTIMTIAQAALKFGAGITSPNPSPSPSLSPTPQISETPPLTPTPTTSPIATSPSETPHPSSTPEVSSAPTQRPETSASPSPSAVITTKPTETSFPTESPTLTVAPTQTSSTNILVTQTCEACGMDVSPAAQERYLINDGTGKIHYAECFMCALNLIKNYDQVHIVTSCDWYGPTYIITVDSSQFGKIVTVSPTTAIFLNGGSCVVNRAAYNKTAADELTRNGFSQYTLPNQQYALPSSTTAMTVKDAAIKFSQNSTIQNRSTSSTVLIFVAIVGIAVIVLSIVAFKKLRK